jgi:hypothetical protein
MRNLILNFYVYKRTGNRTEATGQRKLDNRLKVTELLIYLIFLMKILAA